MPDVITKPKDDDVSKQLQKELTVDTSQLEDGRQIPEVKFIENVEELLTSSGKTTSDYVNALQDLHSKYKYSETTLSSQKSGVRTKLPDIQAAYDLVKYLIAKKEAADADSIGMTYQLSENIYANAEIPTKNDKILLWLGANVMLEYTYEEAVELLETNLKNASEQMEQIKVDMSFVRDQIVTTEVNIARCHNHGVLLKQQEREEEDKKKAVQ